MKQCQYTPLAYLNPECSFRISRSRHTGAVVLEHRNVAYGYWTVLWQGGQSLKRTDLSVIAQKAGVTDADVFEALKLSRSEAVSLPARPLCD